MKYIYGQEKMPLTEALEHHGVKGMKWGVRNDKVRDILAVHGTATVFEISKAKRQVKARSK